MSRDTLLLYLVASAALAITPGPTMLLALANGIEGGMRRAGWGIAGASLGSSLVIATVALGLGSLMAASALLFDALRITGVAYLAWLGVKLWRAEPPDLRAALAAAQAAEETCRVPHGAPPTAAASMAETEPMVGAAAATASAAGQTGRRALLRSLAVALSNPKALLFFAAFLPQFVDPALPQGRQYLVLGLLFVAIDTCVMLAYAAAGTQAVRWLSRRSLRALNRGCAVGMWLLAGGLALWRRVAN